MYSRTQEHMDCMRSDLIVEKTPVDRSQTCRHAMRAIQCIAFTVSKFARAVA